jgi:hypothetical protein
MPRLETCAGYLSLADLVSQLLPPLKVEGQSRRPVK